MTLLIKSLCQSRRYLQSLFLFKKLFPISNPEISTFPSILKSCSSLPSHDAGLATHGYIIKCGVYGWWSIDIGNSLQCMYVKLGQFWDAYKVFEEMPLGSEGDALDCIIHGLGVNHRYEEVMIAFENMVELCYFPNVHSLCHVIRACSGLHSIEKGHFVHDYAKQNGFGSHLVVMNSLISMYVKMGRLDLAQQVFNDVILKDIVSWNSLITGYAQNQNYHKVFDLFLSIRLAENVVPNVVTFLGLLTSVGHAREVGVGMSIHGHLIRSGLYSDVQIGTAIFDMYAKCERLDYVHIIFEQDLISKSLVSWNTLVAAYKQKGYDQEAADIYERMVVEPDTKPDSFSFANVLPAYASLRNLQRIKLIHSMIIKRGLDMKRDVVLSTALLDAYGKCSDAKASELLFACIEHPNTTTWNALISVYNINGQIENGMIAFREMVCGKVTLDPISMVTSFQLCGQKGSLEQGTMIHGFTLVNGFLSNLVVGNALIDMYMRCGCTKSAEVFFRSMSMQNIVTWNTMICGYINLGCLSTGLKLFHQLRLETDYKADSVTIISLLHGLEPISVDYMESFHAYVMKLGLASETQVMNMLINAYAKIGVIEKARALFTQKDFKRDLSSWNIMISGYGMNGQGIESSKLFDQMHENGLAPDAITFVSLLSSCSHCGLIEEGCKYFDLMVTKYKILPSLEHWTCIIDILGRGNDLKEAYDVIRSRIYQKSSNCGSLESGAVWGSLLSSCRTNMNMEIGEVAGQKLLEMKSDGFEYYSLLSNLYSLNRKCDEATGIRRVFEGGKVRKKPGLSSLKS